MKKDVMNNQSRYFVEWNTANNEPVKSDYEEDEGLDASLTIWHFTSTIEKLVFSHMTPYCELICFEDLSDEWKQKYISANTDLYE
jgi:hypothetical protein